MQRPYWRKIVVGFRPDTVDGDIAIPHLCFKTVHESFQLTRLLIAKVTSRLGSHTPFYRLYLVGSGHVNIIAFGALPGGLFA